MVTARLLARLTPLLLGAAVACGSSNAERPFPADAAHATGGGSGETSPGTGGQPGTGGTGGGSGSPATPDAAGTPPADATATPADAAPPATDAGAGPPDTAAEAPGETAPPGAGCPGVPLPLPVPACDAPPPDPGPRRAWRDAFSTLAAVGEPRHRGRDQFLVLGQRQWLIAKFAYGLFDDDIENEDVDIYLLRGCAGTWERLGTVRTTRESQPHPTIDDVQDTGGRVYFEVPAAMALAPGRHRVRFVVAGDLSSAELFIEVVPRGAGLFVSDVDGTLTTSETAEFGGLLTGATPEANAGAAQMLQLLASKGYRPLYLTARPEWLAARTRQFVAARGFPAGIVHTTLGTTGALGDAATTFKTAELAAVLGKGLRPVYAFGNTESDAEAYANARIEPATSRVFFLYTDQRFGGRRIDTWGALQAELTALRPACEF